MLLSSVTLDCIKVLRDMWVGQQIRKHLISQRNKYRSTVFQIFKPFQKIRCLSDDFIVEYKFVSLGPTRQVYEQEIITRHRIWRIWLMKEQFITQFIKICHNDYTRVHTCIILEE